MTTHTGMIVMLQGQPLELLSGSLSVISAGPGAFHYGGQPKQGLSQAALPLMFRGRA